MRHQLIIVKPVCVSRKPFAVKWIGKFIWFKKKKSLQSSSPVFLHPPPKPEPHVMILRLVFFSGLICRAAGAAEGCQGAEVGMSKGGRSALGRLCSQMFPSVGHHLRLQKQNLKCFGRQQIKQIRHFQTV